MKTKITLKAVASLPPGDFIADTETRGFYARRQRTAVVYYVTALVGGRQKRIKIGRHGAPWTPDSARAEAKVILGKIESGDIASQRSKLTVQALSEQWMAEHVRPRRALGTQREYQGHLDDYILPALGKSIAASVTFEQADKLHLNLKDRPTLANRVLATLSAMFGWGRKTRRIPPTCNPTLGVERNEERERHRTLTAEEEARLGPAFKALETRYSPFALGVLKLTLLTGMRHGEARTLKWDHVRLDEAKLYLPKSKTGAKTIFLCPAAVELLTTLPRLKDHPYVFPGGVDGKPYSNLQRAWEALRTEAKIEAIAGDRLRIHDLRHNFATTVLNSGAKLETVGKLLGHSTLAMTQRYARVMDEVAHTASSAAGDRLAKVLKS